jgi:hypothetical protein
LYGPYSTNICLFNSSNISSWTLIVLRALWSCLAMWKNFAFFSRMSSLYIKDFLADPTLFFYLSIYFLSFSLESCRSTYRDFSREYSASREATALLVVVLAVCSRVEFLFVSKFPESSFWSCYFSRISS